VGITLSSLALGAVGQAQLAPLLAPWFTRWGVAGAAASQTTAAIVALLALTGPSGHAHVHSPEELDLQVAESGEGGAGERVTWQGLELTVVSTDGRGVGRCRVRALDVEPPPPAAAPA